MSRTSKLSLFDNLRFYILVSAICMSVFMAGFFRSAIPDTKLYGIRLEEVFGLLSVGYWYIALLITPLSKVVGDRSWVPGLKFSRRALGVSAAYFALLHAGITLYGQLGGWGELKLLPLRFRVSLWFGAVALVVLTAMMLTSLDVAVRLLTFRRWKWLHRLGYIAGVLAIMHIWIVGTHVGGNVVQLIAFECLALLFGLEAIRLNKLLGKQLRNRWLARLAALGLCIVLVLGLVVMRQRLASYANDHKGHAGQLGAASHDHP